MLRSIIPVYSRILCNAPPMHPVFRPLFLGMAFALLLRIIPTAYARVVISEVNWAGSDLSTSDEWVELACVEDSEDSNDSNDSNECSIGGWSLAYVDSKNVEQTMATFAAGTVIGIGEYFLVSNYSATESRLSVEPDVVATAVNVPNTKLLLHLRDAFTAIMDEVDDGIGDPFAGLNSDIKVSMERIDLYGHGNSKDNWIMASTSVNFDVEAPALGTPGASRLGSSVSSVSFVSSFSSSSSANIPRSLFITELLPNPEGSDTEEWIEIGNVGSTPVPIAGLLLSTGTGTSVKKYTIPAGEILEPRTFRSFRAHQTKLTLPNDGGTVSLFSGETKIDAMTYPAIPEGMSYGRTNGSGSFMTYCIPSEREANIEKPVGLGITVQSGDLKAIAKTSLNLTASAPYGPALTGAICRWEYPDGFAPETCNPPSRTLSNSGISLITLHAKLQCGREERATLTVRIDPKGIETRDDNMPAIALPKNSVIISAAVPYSSKQDGTWVSLRNTSDDAVDLTGFTLEGGILPNDRYRFSGVTLLPREERRFAGTLLRMDFPLPGGTLILKDLTKSVQSILAWTALRDGSVVRPSVKPLGSITVQVLRVVDGDSLEVALLDTDDPDLPSSVLHRWTAQEMSLSPAIRVRLIGIDAPELFQETGAISPSGLEALNSVRALIDNQKIELQFDTNYWDDYERLLAYAFLPNSEELLQTALLRNGNAVAERGYSHPYRDYFIAMEEEAKLLKKGMWAFFRQMFQALHSAFA
ncbi:hypothetical protein A3F36_04570 [Candidatus Peribacteria bacterium RIFCSPHIGHO2_12_FULL_55_11]|nr:MAG: hypothetical protein A3F36_04570 [Candidatus Peribacteria bacterium RIFCSPHIGHO2_12_FULL_55_11]